MSQQLENNISQKIFKFHEVSKERFLYKKKKRRTKKPLPVDLSKQFEQNIDDPRSQKTQEILKKYIPIKQKVEVRSDEGCHENRESGLRLVNIGKLLQEPQFQDKPLDLSKKTNGESSIDEHDDDSPQCNNNNPLDLRIKTGSDSAESSPESLISSSSASPPRFIMIQNNNIVQFVPVSSVSTTKADPSVNDDKDTSETSGVKPESSIQMVFKDGNFDHIIPTDESRVKNQVSSSSKSVKRGSRPRSREITNMMKMNQTITKSGALFCTFKNFNRQKPKNVRLQRDSCK